MDFARSIAAKSLAMLVAYLDDTGTHSNSEAVGLLGMLGTTADWNRLEPYWKQNLKVAGVSWFHAADCENGRGEFQGISRGIRDALTTGLINVLGDYRAFAVGSAVMRGDWDAAMPQDAKDRFGNNPIYFCFEHCMQQISLWSKERAGGEPVALVFAEQQEHQKNIEILHRLYSKSRFYSNLGSFSTGMPQQVIPLQAADLVAFEGYRHLRSKVTKQPMRWQAQKLLDSGVAMIAQFHDRDSLIAMLATKTTFPIF